MSDRLKEVLENPHFKFAGQLMWISGLVVGFLIARLTEEIQTWVFLVSCLLATVFYSVYYVLRWNRQ